jgi:leucyl aminopeptidase
MLVKLAKARPARVDLVAVGLTKEDAAAKRGAVDWRLLEAGGFEGKAAQTALVASDGRPILAVGLGPRGEIDPTVLRKAGAAIARAAKRVAKVAVDMDAALPDGLDRRAGVQALVEGLHLGSYRYDALKSDKKRPVLAEVTVVATGAGLSATVARAAVVAQAVAVARDLVNEPGGTMTPTAFAARAQAMARTNGFTATVWNRAAIERQRLGGVLFVNRGSTQEPRFVRLDYRPKGKARGHLALVGKGVTFDSGGLSIKTGQGMMTMKCDMSGAAAVLAAVSAMAALDVPVRVSGWIPLTDNMTGGDASRPGDVFTARNGTTVEVLNTDAEGRLILADALALASDAKPDAIVDLATLTGACMVALGTGIAGLFANDDAWSGTVKAASDRTGERVWPLPLPVDYRSALDSPVADLKNIGGPHGGAITAALFLKEFVTEGIPWAHIDIAGPAFQENEGADHPKGATGFGVRLLLDLAESFRA